MEVSSKPSSKKQGGSEPKTMNVTQNSDNNEDQHPDLNEQIEERKLYQEDPIL